VWSDFLAAHGSDPLYRRADGEIWSGRVDSETDPRAFRIHQIIRVEPTGTRGSGEIPVRRGIAILGFACDAGVARNGGRTGAAAGPWAIRRKLASLPVPWNGDSPAMDSLFDAGDVLCPPGSGTDSDLEAAQQILSEAVCALRGDGFVPLVLGGGHETAWGHFRGLAEAGAGTGDVPAILNIDAHLDMRPDRPGTSGTPFDQAAGLCAERGAAFNYFCAGMRESANTRFLMDHARERGASWCPPEDFRTALAHGKPGPDAVIGFILRSPELYLTVDMDAFSSAWAPGVSAASAEGLSPEQVLPLIDYAAASGRLAGFDVAETNPGFDIDGRTAGLAARLIWSVLKNFSPANGGDSQGMR
jgi:formiminoglutamase